MRPASRLLLATLVLLPTLAPMVEAAGSRVWSAASEMAVVDASAVVETRVLTYDGTYYSNKWTLNVPPNATFREARDASGLLSGSVTGDRVSVTTRGSGNGAYSFTVVFDHRTRAEGPFVGFTARVDGDYDSPTSVKVVLPAGWTLAGWFAGSGSSPDSAGVWRKVGGQYVDLLALPSADPGADPEVDGHGVLREGVAAITATGGRLDLTYTYDTDVYSPVWRIPLPEGATLAGAETPFGPLAASVAGTQVEVVTPYKAGYHLGARSFTLSLGLAAPDPFGGPFLQSNVSIAAADGDVVRLRVDLADDLAHVGDRVVGGERVAPLQYEGDGPLRARVAFLPPVPADQVRFESGAFVVQAPRALEAAARATAANASELLPRVLDHLGAADLTRPFHVAYTDADVFSWEEGFYTHGLDAISIRASELRNVTDGGAHLVPVGTLLHETAHGLVDRLFLHSPDGLSLLHEGLARLAETRVEPFFAGEVVSCQNLPGRIQCLRQSSKPEPDRLQEFLKSGAPLDLTWGAETATADQRGFLYDYSGLLFHSFERLAGPDALRHAVADLGGRAFTDEPAKDAETVVATLLAWAPGLSREMLLYPGKQVSSVSAGQFRACMGDLLPPPYPYEQAEGAPSTGCGWPSVGTRDPPPPPPTPTSPTPPTPTSTTPVTPSPTPTPPTETIPTTSTPITSTPVVSTPPEEDPIDVGRASDPSGTPEAAPVPGPAVGLGLVAILLVARLRRRAS